MKTYAFIDGGYVREEHSKVLRAIGIEGQIAYDRLVGSQVERTFVYDCLDEIPKQGEERASFEERLARDKAFFTRVENLPGVFLRLGILKGRPRKNREPRQKRVDVQLAVDMMKHATRGNMDHAVLYSGDDDFVPVVDALVDAGTRVTVRGVEASTSPALRSSCDTFVPMAPRDLAPATDSETHPVPTWLETDAGPAGDEDLHVVAVGRALDGMLSATLCVYGGAFYLRIELMDGTEGWIACMEEGPAIRLAELAMRSKITWPEGTR